MIQKYLFLGRYSYSGHLNEVLEEQPEEVLGARRARVLLEPGVFSSGPQVCPWTASGLELGVTCASVMGYFGVEWRPVA